MTVQNKGAVGILNKSLNLMQKTIRKNVGGMPDI